ncbi:hypothetical protein D3C78_1658030 [compost metagenome]
MILPQVLKMSCARKLAPSLMSLSWWFCWPMASAPWLMSRLSTCLAPAWRATTEKAQV